MSRTRQPTSNPPQTTTGSEPAPLPATLRLRAEEAPPETSSSRRIRWSEDVVDNEGMGRKSSKVCCIYHKARPVGESSSEESSSDSDSDSDSEDDRRTARMKSRRTQRDSHGHDKDCTDNHDHNNDHDHDHPKPKKAKRKPSPNAYEKMPKPSKNHDPKRGF